MKKLILATVISVCALVILAFGVNVLLAHQSSVKTKAAIAKPSTSAATNTAVGNEPTQPVIQAEQVSQQNTPSPVVTLTSLNYEPSNFVTPDGNVSTESAVKNLMPSWAATLNSSSEHNSDSLVNGSISCRAYIGKYWNNAYNYLYLGLILPTDTVYGKSADTYTYTLQDMVSLVNYFEANTNAIGVNAYIEGSDGKELLYHSDYSKYSGGYKRTDLITNPDQAGGFMFTLNADHPTSSETLADIQGQIPEVGTKLAEKMAN